MSVKFNWHHPPDKEESFVCAMFQKRNFPKFFLSSPSKRSILQNSDLSRGTKQNSSFSVVGQLPYIKFPVTHSLFICPTLTSGVPSNIRLADVRKDLTTIDHVISVHKVHVWSLTAGKTVLSAHMVIGTLIYVHVFIGPYVIVFHVTVRFPRCILQIVLTWVRFSSVKSKFSL